MLVFQIEYEILHETGSKGTNLAQWYLCKGWEKEEYKTAQLKYKLQPRGSEKESNTLWQTETIPIYVA